MIKGECVYQAEIAKLRDELNARGVVLIVIEGSKNKSPIEFGSALTLPDVLRSISVLRRVADEFERDAHVILSQDDYHNKTSAN